MDYMDIKRVLAIVAYRLGQVRQQLGFVRPLSMEEKAEVVAHLPNSALALFQSMSFADQRHALRVYRGLRARGCTEQDMLAAALLHDVGKAGGRVPFWTRPAIVIGKKIAPQILEGNDREARGCNEEGGNEREARGGNEGGNDREASGRNEGGNDREARGCNEEGGNDSAASGRNELRPYIIRGGERMGMKWRRSLANAWYHADVGADLAADAGLSERTVLYIRTHHKADGPAAVLHEVDEIS
jgi:hypothetical protein